MERVIGTIRRECLDDLIVFNEASLYRHIKPFLASYHECRTHLSLVNDAPEPRLMQRRNAEPLSRYRKLTGFITGTSGVPPELWGRTYAHPALRTIPPGSVLPAQPRAGVSGL